MHLAKRHANGDDLCALPEHFVAELIDGDLYASDQPSALHAFVRSGLAIALIGESRKGSLTDWYVAHRPEHHLAGNVLVPDVGAWRRAPGFRLPEAWQDAPPPDWVCEVLDPTSEAVDRHKKLPIYARAGVNHAWIVTPETRTIEVLRRVRGNWVLVAAHVGNTPVRAEPFDAVELDPTEWWGGPETPDPTPT